MDEIAVYERLVSACDVIELLAKEYDRRNDYPNFEACKRAALNTLLTRLKNGYLDGWSTTSKIDSTIYTGPRNPNEIISRWDSHRHSRFPAKIPQ